MFPTLPKCVISEKNHRLSFCGVMFNRVMSLAVFNKSNFSSLHRKYPFTYRMLLRWQIFIQCLFCFFVVEAHSGLLCLSWIIYSVWQFVFQSLCPQVSKFISYFFSSKFSCCIQHETMLFFCCFKRFIKLLDLCVADYLVWPFDVETWSLRQLQASARSLWLRVLTP